MQDFAKEVLPVLDNCERALAEETKDEALHKGVEMIYSQLKNALEKEGVTEIEAEGKPFDGNWHQALMSEHGDVTMKIPAGTQDGARLRLKGKGVVDIRGGKQGDQICTVRVKVDENLTKQEKELYKQLQEMQNNGQGDTVWQKFKNSFKN